MALMSKRLLRELGIYNSYDIAKLAHSKLFLSYANDQSRGGKGIQWQVYGVGFKTAPDAPWYDHGMKTFVMYSPKEKEDVLQAAKAWCLAEYGILEWEKDVFECWHPVGTIEAAIKAKNDSKL